MSSRDIPRPTVGQRLQMARQHAGFEQDQLARRLNVSRQTVSNAERGRYALRPELLEAWSEATNVDADWIREGVEERSEADDLVDQIARLVLSRARRDSNPQPSDLESVVESAQEFLVDEIPAVVGRAQWAVAA